MLNTIVMLASSRAACSWAYRSRTTVRAITAPLDMASPWMNRAAATAPTDSTCAAASDAAAMAASPAQSTGLRP